LESIVAAIGQHGYVILFFVVLAEAVGLPIPAALGLLVAGGASARGAMRAAEALPLAILAMLVGDNLLFLLGRYTGWWLLSVLCRVSLNPEACIMRSADSFYRRGRIMLVFAKFLPGINTMAPPLAGSMGMRLPQFFSLDAAGASLYILTWFGTGYLFSDFLSVIRRGYSAFGALAEWAIGAAFLIWFATRLQLWLRSRKGTPVPMMTPREIASRSNVAIFDVRSHGYYEPGTMRIAGSRRLDPHAIADHLKELPKEKEIVLYCTCLREATAVRVARLLAEQGIPSAVIAGGLGAWKKASLPLEPVPAEEVILLPKFS
jgi:membrane protein DedA with SNARE-associated domain/rhodanese-related sulfurtransferase